MQPQDAIVFGLACLAPAAFLLGLFLGARGERAAGQPPMPPLLSDAFWGMHRRALTKFAAANRAREEAELPWAEEFEE